MNVMLKQHHQQPCGWLLAVSGTEAELLAMLDDEEEATAEKKVSNLTKKKK